MPYKHLTAPKQIGTLDGDVVATAQLEPFNRFYVLTNDPVSLAYFPFTGTAAGTGKATNVSLGSVNDLAMITRDVAVVRSEDDLWALLDIQHTAKMDQVGRDIRSLVACPKGETALAIGWDGQGAALGLRQYEVGGRQFTVRGELRSCDMSVAETFVVVDSGAGGQYRIHSGTTPESGAKARADLPADAVKYDQLAGGREMSAAYKKKGNQVCVITRDAANNCAAKIVTVDTQVLAANVAATSLLVIGVDGRVRLFNADTLNRSESDEPMAPTAAVDVPARGEPSTLSVTLKGGVKIWVGTKAGEVFRLEATTAGLDL
ncbi:MAG: hypothetical protein JRI23_03755 [Deltaproteobacteria bacterium]|jgi:hypothetical protein|nr:hypothetical protein [Deltaproteobacteria bacterium]MBW2530634.1 hypothetical protein [Deltaproteobacteria bacterium]